MAPKVGAGRCKATWKKGFRLPWREAASPYHHDDKFDQKVGNKELSLWGQRAWPAPLRGRCRDYPSARRSMRRPPTFGGSDHQRRRPPREPRKLILALAFGGFDHQRRRPRAGRLGRGGEVRNLIAPRKRRCCLPCGLPKQGSLLTTNWSEST